MARKESNKPSPQGNVSAPLLSWDIVMEGYWKKMSLADDKLALQKMAAENAWQQEWDFETILLQQGKVIIVTDPLLHIVFSSSNIAMMTGYTTGELLGKTPAIFQGKDTDLNTRKDIRAAINERRSFNSMLVNYKKNGDAYHCNIEGFPVFNKGKQLINFIAFEGVAEYK